MIARVAYLNICVRCKKHGHVVLPGGKTSSEFITTVQAYKEVDRLVVEKDILVDEAKHLRESIRTSVLPSKEDPLLKVLEEVIGIREEIEEILHQYQTGTKEGEEKPPTLH